jgi:hypothetical protein
MQPWRLALCRNSACRYMQTSCAIKPVLQSSNRTLPQHCSLLKLNGRGFASKSIESSTCQLHLAQIALMPTPSTCFGSEERRHLIPYSVNLQSCSPSLSLPHSSIYLLHDSPTPITRYFPSQFLSLCNHFRTLSCIMVQRAVGRCQIPTNHHLPLHD